jgi:hypothetical protein
LFIWEQVADSALEQMGNNEQKAKREANTVKNPIWKNNSRLRAPNCAPFVGRVTKF